jgi:hypothetical protein
MLKILVVLYNIFYLFASDFSDDLWPVPMRRSASGDASMAAYYLKHGTLAEKLIAMVSYFDSAELGITERKITRLVRESPIRSNPYSDMHNAYLITLASRYGLLNVVKSIVENKPDSINCLSYGYTPLDEAIEFRKCEVADYLRKNGGVQKRTSSEQLNALLQVHRKKRKSCC